MMGNSLIFIVGNLQRRNQDIAQFMGAGIRPWYRQIDKYIDRFFANSIRIVFFLLVFFVLKSIFGDKLLHKLLVMLCNWNIMQIS